MGLDAILWLSGLVVAVGCIVTGVIFHQRQQAERRNLNGETVMHETPGHDATMATLPAYFVVIEGGEENPGARKALFSQYGDMRFGFERETREVGQDPPIPNRVRVRSRDVSRRMETQGCVQYDGARGQYIIFNYGNRAEGRNPIVVGSRVLEPGESVTLESGAEVRIGKVRMVFHNEV